MTDENDVKLDGKSNGYPWLKVYTDLPDNPKLRTLTDAQKWRYVHLYLLAGKADAGGLLALDGELLDAGALAWYLRIDTDTMQSDIDKMMKARLLNAEGEGFAISSFMDEQGSSHAEKREQWRVRQERRRNKLAMLQDEETEQEPDEEQDKSRKEEEKKRKEEDKTRQEVTPLSRVTNSVVVSFLSLFTDVEVSVLSQLEGELVEEIAFHFTQVVKNYGKEKVFGYLRWVLEEGKAHTWRYAYNIDTGQEKVKNWEVPEAIHFDNEPPTTYEDVLVNGKWVSRPVEVEVCETEMELAGGAKTMATVHRKKTPTII